MEVNESFILLFGLLIMALIIYYVYSTKKESETMYERALRMMHLGSSK